MHTNNVFEILSVDPVQKGTETGSDLETAGELKQPAAADAVSPNIPISLPSLPYRS